MFFAYTSFYALLELLLLVPLVLSPCDAQGSIGLAPPELTGESSFPVRLRAASEGSLPLAPDAVSLQEKKWLPGRRRRGRRSLLEGGAVNCPRGLKYTQLCVNSGLEISATGGHVPPCPHGAVGPLALLAVTNSWIECRWKDSDEYGYAVGELAWDASLGTMFASLSPNQIFYPKVVYDFQKDCFVVMALDISVDSNGVVIDSNILVAASYEHFPPSETEEDWFFEKIPSLINGTWADFPGLSVDQNFIYITTNMLSTAVNGPFVRSLLWIIEKNEFYDDDYYYNGTTPFYTSWDFIAESGGTGVPGTHMPAMVRAKFGISKNVSTYLVMYDGLTDGTNELVQVVEVGNTDNASATRPTFRAIKLSVGDIDVPGNLSGAPQAGTSALLDTNDRKVMNAVWTKGVLWFTATTKRSSGQAVAYWFKVNATGQWPPSLLDLGPIDGDLISPGTYTWAPAIDANEDGTVGFGVAVSSGSMYGSAYATIRDDKLDSPGTIRKLELVKDGVSKYNIMSGGNRNRWGDYSAVALDPYDPSCFWAYNQYAGLRSYTTVGGQFGEWKTRWVKLCYTRITSAPTKTPTRAPTKRPTKVPTNVPTRAPTKAPTATPTTAAPSTKSPTEAPTRNPTKAPTTKPTLSMKPTNEPTKKPTQAPVLTQEPTHVPTTMRPTKIPTTSPTLAPTLAPTQMPTLMPTNVSAPVCLNLTQACVYRKARKNDACCGKLVCRKRKQKNKKYSCLKCLKKGSPCVPTQRNACCSKKCSRISNTKPGTFCK